MRDNLRGIFAGAFAEADTPADLIYLGSVARSEIEDDLDLMWASFDRAAFDYYDNSIEIYFEDHIVDLEPTPEQLAAIWSWGFSRCWLNFQGGKRAGGSERYYTNPTRAARRQTADVSNSQASA